MLAALTARRGLLSKRKPDRRGAIRILRRRSQRARERMDLHLGAAGRRRAAHPIRTLGVVRARPRVPAGPLTPLPPKAAVRMGRARPRIRRTAGPALADRRREWEAAEGVVVLLRAPGPGVASSARRRVASEERLGKEHSTAKVRARRGVLSLRPNTRSLTARLRMKPSATPGSTPPERGLGWRPAGVVPCRPSWATRTRWWSGRFERGARRAPPRCSPMRCASRGCSLDPSPGCGESSQTVR